MVAHRGTKTVGLLTIILSLFFFGGGIYVWYKNIQSNDGGGFATSQSIKITTDAPLIIFSDHSFNMRDEIPSLLQSFYNPDDFMSERWTLQNNMQKDVFIGIATATNAQDYCKLTQYKEANDWDVIEGPWETKIWVNSYTTHFGDYSIQPPNNSTIWLTSGSGSSQAEFEKLMVSGNYWVIIMNNDGSAGLDVNLTVGNKMPLLLQLPIILVGIGLLLGAFGLILYLRKKKPD